MRQHFARKTVCEHGHKHNSGAEAKRCAVLHRMQAEGKIIGLKVEPRFHFAIEGREVKMGNGQVARYTGDFTYIEGNKQVVEDVKAKNGFVERDVPLRLAFFRHLYPDIELRIVK